MNLPLPKPLLPNVLSSSAPPPRAPQDLHPAVWRANQLGGGRQGCTASGFAALDAELPGGGWPHRVLTELLLPHAGVGEWRLLAPALAALGGRCVMLFDPPAAPCTQALAQLGLDARQWLVVQGRTGCARGADGRPGGAVGPGAAARTLLRSLLPGADTLWALEQALKSGHVGAALAWLPAALKADALRRLQLAAQAHDGPVFVFRDVEARQRPSAAPLRLLLQPGGFDALAVQLLKRRGPPLAQPLRLVLPPVLTPQAHGRVPAPQPGVARGPRAVAARPGRAASV